MPSGKAEFLNGVPELVVLRLLAARPMYGYELVQAIRRETGESFRFGEGVVYPLLHALQRKGYLKAKEQAVNARVRVYYRLTAKGQKHLASLTQRWHEVSGTVTALLGSEPAVG